MDLTAPHIIALELGLAVSLARSFLLVATTRWHGRFTLKATRGVQKFHSVPTPRIGGLAIMLGLLCAWMASSVSQQVLPGPLLAAAAPAFLFGIAEDLTRRVSIGARLVATLASGVPCWALTGVSIAHTGIGLLDTMLRLAAARRSLHCLCRRRRGQCRQHHRRF